MVTSPPRRARRSLFHFWVLLCLGLAVLSACSDTAGVATRGDRTAAAEEQDQGAARDCRYAESSCSTGFQCSEVEAGQLAERRQSPGWESFSTSHEDVTLVLFLRKPARLNKSRIKVAMLDWACGFHALTRL